jgi:HEAT repeat protein
MHDPDATFEAARPLVLNPDASIAIAAVEAIGRLSATRHRDVLFEAIAHTEPEVVKVALSEISSQLDAHALTQLARGLEHDSWDVRRLACELLGGRARDGVQAMLHARLEREKEPLVREALMLALSIRPSLPSSKER